MKYFFLLLLTVSSHLISAQTMALIPLAKGSVYGSCVNTDPKKQGQLCYGLQYTPNTTGTLTSYTTGFFVSCTSIGAPITVNRSCTMSNQVSMQNACTESNLVLINSSGHSGSSANNKVEKDVPVILHQICFSIPLGESVTVREDEVTDLTVSIDIASGVFVTEYPSFTQVEIKRPRYDISKPVAFLDFKIVPLVDFTTELDWTTSRDADTDHFIIERSSDASDFITIGEVRAGETGVDKEIFQFMDRAALEGNNYYRIQQVNSRGEIEYSPIRMVTFGPLKFEVRFSPSPAKEYLDVFVQSVRSDANIQLIDASGHIVRELKCDRLQKENRLQVNDLNPGVYTLVVRAGEDKFSDKVMIVE